MTLVEIAARIDAHLQRMEAAQPEAEKRGTGVISRFWRARAWRAGAYCAVKYVSYQHQWNLLKPEAENYLGWLDAGNDGKHYEIKEPKS